MNCQRPWAPTPDRALGLSADSAQACALARSKAVSAGIDGHQVVTAARIRTSYSGDVHDAGSEEAAAELSAAVVNAKARAGSHADRLQYLAERPAMARA